MKHTTLVRQLSVRLSAVLFVACAVMPRVEARQAKTFDFAELERAVEAELKAGHTPGEAVAVVRGDRIIYVKGFGVTSAEAGGTAVTPDTLFRMGSTTKMFTAAALVTLASEGKFRLDAPIGDYVKNLPPKNSYSSPNYWLAGFIVEELSGRPYSDAMRELVFKPLGMRRTTLRPLEAMTHPLALGHNVEQGELLFVPDERGAVGHIFMGLYAARRTQ